MTDAAIDFKFEADMILQMAKEKGVERGFYIDDFKYSGFYSQGDGASWQGGVRVPEYIDWKLGQGGIEGIPNVTAELMFWLFNAGVFDSRLSVGSRGHYCHEKTMQLSDIYWTYIGSNDTETMGAFGGPFSETPIKQLLQATNWGWESESQPDDYYNRLWATILNDARDYAKDVYKQLEEAYEAAQQEAEAAEPGL
jgi:hypothetical protein